MALYDENGNKIHPAQALAIALSDYDRYCESEVKTSSKQDLLITISTCNANWSGGHTCIHNIRESVLQKHAITRLREIEDGWV